MIEKILNIGVSDLNVDHLNRKIRIGNLICLITIITMVLYIPPAVYFNVMGIIISNALFLLTSFLGFYLHFHKKHNSAFYITCFYGLVYFVFGSVLYGLESNLHFFILIMCLISIALFSNINALRIYIGISVISFFVLIFLLKNKPGLIELTDVMRKVQGVISILNLFLLFLRSCLYPQSQGHLRNPRYRTNPFVWLLLEFEILKYNDLV